jgi:lipooligosaccharide transport system permease protein
VIWGLGLHGNFWLTLAIIPVVALVGFCFGGMGLVMNAVSPSYDFFLYYFTLAITPMVLLCGVFFPVSQLPPVLQAVSAWLPLTHAIDLARPLVVGRLPDAIGLHVFALLAYGTAGYVVALALTRKRLLR